MCIERLQEIVKGTFELELKRRAEELAKPLGDEVMNDLMGEITARMEDEMAGLLPHSCSAEIGKYTKYSRNFRTFD